MKTPTINPPKAVEASVPVKNNSAKSPAEQKKQAAVLEGQNHQSSKVFQDGFDKLKHSGDGVYNKPPKLPALAKQSKNELEEFIAFVKSAYLAQGQSYKTAYAPPMFGISAAKILKAQKSLLGGGENSPEVLAEKIRKKAYSVKIQFGAAQDEIVGCVKLAFGMAQSEIGGLIPIICKQTHSLVLENL